MEVGKVLRRSDDLLHVSVQVLEHNVQIVELVDIVRWNQPSKANYVLMGQHTQDKDLSE